MSDVIVTYARGENRNPIGCLAAVRTEDGYDIGWSICHDNDSFNKKRARQIAIGRAKSGRGESIFNFECIPGSKVEFLLDELESYFVPRCDKYFKPKQMEAD
jgi:hypothetical protein